MAKANAQSARRASRNLDADTTNGWVVHYAAFMNRLNALRPREWDERRKNLNKLLREQGVPEYAVPLFVPDRTVPDNPSPRQETAALRAVKEDLERPYDFLDRLYDFPGLLPERRKELETLCFEALRAVKARLQQLKSDETNRHLEYVTLDQMAAVVNRSKRTLERLKTRMVNPLPQPKAEGGGGKPDEWVWSEVRPWLEAEYNKNLAEHFPGSRLLSTSN
jgi:hypothetical protein